MEFGYVPFTERYPDLIGIAAFGIQFSCEKKGDVTLLKGTAARSKLVRINGIKPKEMERRITALLSASGTATRPLPGFRPTAD